MLMAVSVVRGWTRSRSVGPVGQFALAQRRPAASLVRNLTEISLHKGNPA